MANNYGGKDSEFNWAALFIKSLDEQASILAQTNINPLYHDGESGRYYYEIGIETLLNLFIKLSSHLSNDEIEKGKKLRKLLLGVVTHFPIFEKEVITSLGGRSEQKKINFKNLNMLREIMFEFQLEIFQWIEKHKLGTPAKKDPAKAALDF